jgi:hypothetical protein
MMGKGTKLAREIYGDHPLADILAHKRMIEKLVAWIQFEEDDGHAGVCPPNNPDGSYRCGCADPNREVNVLLNEALALAKEAPF